MADRLPLIPEMGGAVCADIRPVLRHVFRDEGCLPPLAAEETERSHEAGDDGRSLPKIYHWVENYSSECKEIWRHEDELKHQHAKRIARDPLPNIYKLYSPKRDRGLAAWKKERGIIQRKDLVPSIVQDSGKDARLWIKNILARSSSEFQSIEVHGSCASPVNVMPSDQYTVQSVSIGEVIVRPPAPLTPVPHPPPLPEYVVCVPPKLDFVNFTVGQLHTQTVRLVNVSKLEVRLSVRPPARRELSVEVAGARGLALTAGAAGALRVHLRARGVRPLRGRLLVRVSAGGSLVVPIACYMQPPLLDILVPSVSSSLLSCVHEEARVCGAEARSGEVVELGARLLGEEHRARLLLHCDAHHAAFFILAEDAWLSFCLDAVTPAGSVVCGPFVVWPAWWGGGGWVRGAVWCRARGAGLQAAALRVLASTAVVRPLHLLADSLHFRPDHLTVEAQEKDYDICSEDDPVCEYFVHLGTAFPHRPLTATVQLVNHSPLIYTFYWSVRPWGVCSCWEEQKEMESSVASAGDSEQLCIGAQEARAIEKGGLYEAKAGSGGLVRVEPNHGQIAARSTCAVHVCAPDAGDSLGTQRAVLMLIVKNIPKESFPPDYDPMIVSTEVVDVEPIPGVKGWSREVCEVVYLQMEVWWEVAPVRFVLDPPVLPLYHSRRVQSVELVIRATQLFGSEGVCAAWDLAATAPLASSPRTARLTPAHSCAARLCLLLPELPNECPSSDAIKLVAANEEWESCCTVVRQCAARHPALRPARAWRGHVAPGARVHADLQLVNDTQQQIYWWGTWWRWWGERGPSAACEGGAPCSECRERACACALLRPARGALPHGGVQTICYDVNAPDSDGCVATLVQVRRTAADVAGVGGTCGAGGRGALVAYRVLAPRLLVRALPCGGDKAAECEGCSLDEGELNSPLGTAILRPGGALTLGRRTCYRLKFTNLTPLPTRVQWEPPLGGDDILQVIFIPNDFDVGGHAEVVIQVVAVARRVCARRVFVLRARTAHDKHLYLLVDTAIAGLEISCEVPLGGGADTDSFFTLRRSQVYTEAVARGIQNIRHWVASIEGRLKTNIEEHSWDVGKEKPSTPEEIFAEDDRRRRAQREHVCRCPYELVYVPPVEPRPPKHAEDPPPVEIVCEPPPLARVCPCTARRRPVVPDQRGPCCLQYWDVPVGTVRCRTIVLRNLSPVAAGWRGVARRWPRHAARSLHTEACAGAGARAGVAVECAGGGGVLAGRASVRLGVRVYADCWGLYRDQILIQIDGVEPIVLDVWVGAVGSPLQFALKPAHAHLHCNPILWVSARERARAVRATNASRCGLRAHAYLLTDHVSQHSQGTKIQEESMKVDEMKELCLNRRMLHSVVSAYPDGLEHPQQQLPFRVYLRLFDVPPPMCPCLNAQDSDVQLEGCSQSVTSSFELEMDTGIELYLAADYGRQDNTYFKVHPEVMTIPAQSKAEWSVTLLPAPHCELAPPTTLLLRLIPLDRAGEGWYRPEPPPRAVSLRQAPREGQLRASCREVCVKLCALDLPHGDVMRVRKRFRIQNVGNGPLEVSGRTQAPWCIVRDDGHHEVCGAGCRCGPAALREGQVLLHLEPRSSTEICVEVCVHAGDAGRAVAAAAGGGADGDGGEGDANESPLIRTTTPLLFFDDHNVLLKIQLTLELELPALVVEPQTIDFGFVADGDTRKTYFTVSHTSRTVTLDVVTDWCGDREFHVWPPALRVAPGTGGRVYVQYTARWCGTPAEGTARVRVARGAGRVLVVRGAGGAGGAGGAAVRCRGTPARDRACAAPAHDHTDDTHLLPPHLTR